MIELKILASIQIRLDLCYTDATLPIFQLFTNGRNHMKKKKLFIALVIAFGLSIGNVAFAGVFKPNNCLSIALNNQSPVTVRFSTAADPGYIPEVKPKQDYTLPGDFMQTCYNNACTIFITLVDGSKPTVIQSVPRGTRITYRGQNIYQLDTHANVHCP